MNGLNLENKDEFFEYQVSQYGGTYIHNNWINFQNTVQSTIGNESLDKYLSGMKTILYNLMLEEYQFYKNIETAYIAQSGLDRDVLLKRFRLWYESVRNSKTSRISKIADLKTIIDKSKESKKKATRFIQIGLTKKDKKGKEKPINRLEIKDKDRWEEMLEYYRANKIKLLEAIQSFVNTIEKLMDDPSKNLELKTIAISKNLKSLISDLGGGEFKTIIDKWITGKIALDDNTLIKIYEALQAGSYQDFTAKVWTGLDPNTDEGKKEALKTDNLIFSNAIADLGYSFEDILPEDAIDYAFNEATADDNDFFSLITGGNKSFNKEGTKFAAFNVTDLSATSIKIEIPNMVESIPTKEIDVTIGLSLKYIRDNELSKKYEMDDYINDYMSSELDKLERIDFLTYLRMNFNAALSNEIDIKQLAFGQEYLEFDRSMSEIRLLPRFLNGFSKKIQDGEFVAYDPKVKDSEGKTREQDMSYTVFLLTKDNIYWMSDFWKSIIDQLSSSWDITSKNSTWLRRGEYEYRNFKKVDYWNLWKKKEKLMNSISEINSQVDMYNEFNLDASLKAIFDVYEKDLNKSSFNKVGFTMYFDKVIAKGGQ